MADKSGERTTAVIESLETRLLLSAAPIASAKITQLSSHQFYFSAARSHVDINESVAKYIWRFGDGAVEYGSPVLHTYATTTTYQVSLQVIDTADQSNIFRTKLKTGDLDHTASISGRLYEDINENRHKDASEPWRGGVNVFIDEDGDGAYNIGVEPLATTSSRGTFYFTGLAAGTYHVRQTMTVEEAQTTPGREWVVQLADGQAVTGRDFGIVRRAGITGRIRLDSNGNGIAESGEPFVAGRRVWIDTNNNAVLDAGEQITTSVGDGYFSFRGVPLGNYYLRLVIGAGETQTTPGKNAAILIRANRIGEFGTGTFQFTGVGGIGGTIYDDRNDNKIQDTNEPGVRHADVFLDENNNFKIDDGEAHTETDSRGRYLFANQPARAVNIRYAMPGGFRLPGKSVSAESRGLQIKANQTVAFNIAATTKPSISGQIFDDRNGNGTRENGESTVPASVYADLNRDGRRSNDEPIIESTGSFWFLDLPRAGAYLLRVLPSDTLGDVGDALQVTLSAGEIKIDLDFAVRKSS
ncbi:hypothetical protein BH09PLA1_BH09PLA1_19660 [soil metagenome]